MMPRVEAYTQQLKARDGLSSPAVLAVVAHIAAYRHGEPWLDALRDYLQDNLTYVAERLNQAFSGTELATWPQATLPGLASICARWGIDDRQLQQVLIEREKGCHHAGLHLRRKRRPWLPAAKRRLPSRSKVEAGMDKLINGLKAVSRRER